MPPRPSSPKPPLDRALLDDPAGFASWTAHLLDEHGNGAFLSWGFGLPLTRLAGAGGPARQAPGLSVLILAQGVPSLWLHQRFPEEDAAWEAPAGRWRFGSSQIEALSDLKAQVVIAQLDCALPGTRARLTGHIEMGGTPRRGPGEDASERDDEDWAPLMGPGEGRAILTVGREHHFHLQGRAYHHRHGQRGRGGGAALLGFGHVPLADRDVSFQVRLDEGGRGRASGLVVHLDGRSERLDELEAEAEGPPERPSRLLLRRHDATWLDVVVERLAHERGVERSLVTRCRAPLALPAVGTLAWTDARALADPRQRRRARRFVHAVDERSPLGVRMETGPARDRWRRALGLG